MVFTICTVQRIWDINRNSSYLQISMNIVVIVAVYVVIVGKLMNINNEMERSMEEWSQITKNLVKTHWFLRWAVSRKRQWPFCWYHFIHMYCLRPIMERRIWLLQSAVWFGLCLHCWLMRLFLGILWIRTKRKSKLSASDFMLICLAFWLCCASHRWYYLLEPWKIIICYLCCTTLPIR